MEEGQETSYFQSLYDTGKQLVNASGAAADVIDKVSGTATELGFQHKYLDRASDLSSHLRRVDSMTSNGILPTVAHPYVSTAIYAMFLTLFEMVFKKLFIKSVVTSSNLLFIFTAQVILGLVVSKVGRSLCWKKNVVSDWLAEKVVYTLTFDNLRSLFSKSNFMWQIGTSVFFMLLSWLLHYAGFTFGTLAYGLLLFTVNRIIIQLFSL